MLSKAKRVSRPLFVEYFKRGVRRHSPLMTVLYTPLNQFKAAVVVGKKVALKAHDRNVLKRRLYAHVALLSKRDQLTGAYLILLKPEARKVTSAALLTECSKLISNR